MTKTRATRKAFKNDAVIKIGYCEAANLLRYQQPVHYTTRREGWASDIYYNIQNDTYISTGYAPFGHIKPDYKLTREYDDKAFKICRDDTLSHEEKKRSLI